MAAIEESASRLSVKIGWRRFNGCEAVFDRSSGVATVKGWNFFVPFARTVPLEEIAEVRYVRQKSAAYPRLHLRSGQRIAMPSAGIRDAQVVVPVIQAFLGVGGTPPP